MCWSRVISQKARDRDNCILLFLSSLIGCLDTTESAHMMMMMMMNMMMIVFSDIFSMDTVPILMTFTSTKETEFNIALLQEFAELGGGIPSLRMMG